MKTIFLLRHAQAGSSDTGSDFDRPLTPQGLADAGALGRYIEQKNYKPEIVLCSAAKRTQETFKTLGIDANAQFMDEIYHAGRGELFAMLQKLDNEAQSAMIVGHNPVIYALAGLLASSGPDSLMNRLTQGYQPATLSVIESPCDDWAKLHPDENTLIDLASPIDYNAPERPTRWM